MPFQKVKFEFPEVEAEETIEIDIEPSSAEPIKRGGRAEAAVEQPAPKARAPVKDDDFEVDIIDDTPEADRGRTSSEPPEEVTDEELADYSDKVRKRIKHFSKGYHDERRAKETAMREKTELERFAQQLVDENQKLKTSGTKSQTALIEQAKRNAKTDVDAARTAYKAAHDAGDSDALLEAQEKLMATTSKLERISNIKVPALQVQETPVQANTAPAPALQADQQAVDWKNRNSWFQTDDEMTSFALGLHNKLVKEGVNPRSNDYYERIDARMRTVFPEQFEDTTPDNPKPKRRASVVAPATRSTAPKRVTLTKTQVHIAKRLGLTNEQYARQVALDMEKQDG